MNTKRNPSLLLACILATVGGVHAVEPAHPTGANLTEEWIEVRFQGNKMGYLHMYDVDTERDGRTVHYSATEMVHRSRRGEQTTKSVTREITWSELDGRLIEEAETSRDGEQVTTCRTVVRNGVLIVTKTLNKKEEITEIPIPKNTVVHVGFEPWLLKRTGFEEGGTYEYTVFSNETMRLEKETTKTIGREKRQFGGEMVDVFVYTGARTDMPGVTVTGLVSADFRPLLMTAGPMEMRNVGKQKALALDDAPPDMYGDIPVAGAVPAWAELDRMTLEIAVKHDEEGKIFRTTPYARVLKAERGRYKIELVAVPAPDKCGDALPLRPDDAEAATCLGLALMYQSDHPEIRKAAAQIVGAETNALAAARAICAWVHQNIQAAEIDTATASALETLRAKKGDCTEHAALFCALARAAGIPAREARGIAFRGGGFGGHAWNEVYLGGRWVPVDATIDFVGLPAGSILFETCDGKSAKALSVAAWLALKSEADIQITSATRRGETFDPRNDKETVVVTEEALRDHANDITVDLRGGMKVLQDGPPIVILSPTRHTLVVASVTSAMANDEDWNTFAKELFGGMGAPVPAGVKPERQSVGGKTIYRATFPEVATQVPLGVEVRVVSSRGFSVATVVAAQKEIFGASREEVQKLLDRVTVGTPAKAPDAGK